MKKKIFSFFSFLMVIALCIGIVGCHNQAIVADVWEEAIYKENAEFGDGAKTIMVEVVAEGNSVTFTIHSDKNTLGDALAEHHLIEGEKGAYGLYVKKVNGITADYDINKCYWGINKSGESLMTGVDGVELQEGEHYELVYIKPE